MTTIANTTDFLRLLREDPEFRAEVRRELQLQELMELPARFDAFVAQTQQEFSDIKARLGRLEDVVAGQQVAIGGLLEAVAQLQEAVAQLQAAVAQLQAAVTRLEGTVARMDGRIGRLEGVDYERHVSRTFMGVLSSALGRLRRGRLLHSVAYGTTTEFSDLMEDLLDADKISEDQWHEILLSDAVVRGVKNGETVYAVAEISLTVHQRDIDRAAERAAMVQQATGVAAYPVVVGASVPPPQMAQASEKGVTAIIVRQPGG